AALRRSCDADRDSGARGYAAGAPLGVAHHGIRDDAASEHAGHRAKAGPGGVADEPEPRRSQTVRNRALVRVVEALPDPADRSARSAGVALVGSRRRDLEHERLLGERRVNAAGKPDEPLAGGALP